MARAARSAGTGDTILLGAAVLLSLLAMALPDRMRDPFSGVLRRTVMAPLVILQENAEASRKAWQMRDERTLAHDSIVRRSQELEAVQFENARLRQILGLGGRLEWGFIPVEVMVGRGVSEESTVLLSAGTRAGVRAFSPVVAPEGVVGVVQSADPRTSVAILWTHPDFRVSAMSEDGSTFGIVAGHLAQGPERYMLEMRGVPFRQELSTGTLVVSSGLGGVFPRGLPIGTVVAERPTNEVWARTYLLRPAVTPSEISSVMVLAPPRAAAGVSGVWMAGRNVDSAGKAVAIAGDSILREDARAIEEAMQAQVDLRALRDSIAAARQAAGGAAQAEEEQPAAARTPAPAAQGSAPAAQAPPRVAPQVQQQRTDSPPRQSPPPVAPRPQPATQPTTPPATPPARQEPVLRFDTLAPPPTTTPTTTPARERRQ